MIWLAIGAVFVVAMFVLVLPLWRHTEHPLPAGLDGGMDDAEQDRLDEKKRLLANLRALRLDFSEGKLVETDFRALETECEQQLAMILDSAAHAQAVTPQIEPRRDFHRMGSIALVLVLAMAAFPLFSHFWKPAPGADGAPPHAAGQGAPDIDAMVARLEQKLAANPKDLAGLLMLARSYANLGRQDEAAGLWRKVLELDSGNSEARSSLAIALLQSGSEQTTLDALQHLKTLREAEPEEPAWLWYESMGLAMLGRKDEARKALEKILALVPAESENGRAVQDALRQLGN